MTSPTPAELQAMRALAVKATPGPWHPGTKFRNRVLAGEGDRRSIVCGTCLPADEHKPLPSEIADAAFIAAANPQAVIALIDALESARAAIRALLELDNRIVSAGGVPLKEVDAVKQAARAHLGGQALTPVVAQCSGCRAYTRDRRALTCCKGYCQDSTGKSCNALPCPGCGRHHYWCGSFNEPGPDATIFDAPDGGQARKEG